MYKNFTNVRSPAKHDPFYGNLEDLYHEEFEAMGIFDDDKTSKLISKKQQDLYLNNHDTA
jgi:hypothetical protein